MDASLIIFIAAIILCYIYAFVGGFTDAANAIATAVGSRSLSPKTAVLMAGTLEIAGALFGTAVALTIGKGIVSLESISLVTVLAALVGTMIWSLITYSYGIPVSETHGLIGSIIGAGVASGGWEVVLWSGLSKTLIAIIVSPIAGFLGSFLLMGLIYRVFYKSPAATMIPLFRNLQRLSSAFMAFSHGQNDAQKPMGMLVMVLAIYYGIEEPTVPVWVILSVGLVAGIGVAYGGWRIIKTLGMRITALSPEQGFVAETAAATTLEIASMFGIPVSTTHTITASIVGAGTARHISSVRWGVFLDIFLSWVLTLPATILFGWICGTVLHWLLG